MALILSARLRLDVSPNLDRRSIRVFLGPRELEADGPLFAAVLQVCAGGSVAPELLRRLVDAGVLVQVPDAPAAGPIQLAPEVAITLGFGARAVGANRVRPVLSLPVMAFVPPEILGPLQDLGDRVRHGWDLMLRATHGADRSLDRPEMARRLAAVAARELRDRPELAALLEVVDEAPWTVRPRVPLQSDEVQYPVQWVELADDRDPRHRGQPPVRVELRSDAALRELGELLAELAVGGDLGDLRARWSDRPQWRTALHQIASRGLCRPAPSPPLRPPKPGEVVHLGHATLWANLGERVLVDPWFPGGSRGDGERAPSLGELGPVAAVFFTHHHWDHVDPATLLLLDKDVPIYVPAQPADRPLIPKTAAWLRWWGFRRVHELRHGERVAFSEGEVVAAPFTGEDPSDLGFAGNTYVVAHRGRAALVHVDCGPTLDGRSLVSDGTIAALVAEHGPLSPVFATRRQERGTLVEHGWPFLLRPSDRWTRPVENCCTGAAFLGALARAAGAAELVLYSEGGAPWYPDDTDFLRDDAEHAPWTDVVTYLWDDLPALRSAVEPAARLRTSRAADRYAIGAGVTAPPAPAWRPRSGSPT